MTGASLPALLLDQRLPQVFALLLAQTNMTHIRRNAVVMLIEILQGRLHELRWADDLVLEPFPGNTVVRGTLPGLLQVGTYQVLRLRA